MAEKKKSAPSGGNKKSGSAAPKAGSKTVVNTSYASSAIPGRIVWAALCAGFFLLQAVVTLRPEGALPLAFRSFILGMLGEGGYYILLLAMPYLIWVLAVMKRCNVRMRCLATGQFVLLFGMMHQLLLPQLEASGFVAVISKLYLGGIEGSAAGLICGGLAMLVEMICGKVIAFLVLMLLSAICLLRAFEITLSGLYQAIAARSPQDEEDLEDDDYPDPAERLVSGVIAKREKLAQRRQQKLLEEEYELCYDDDEEEDGDPSNFLATKISGMLHAGKSYITGKTQPHSARTPIEAPAEEKIDKLMRQMDEDIDTPLSSHNRASQPEEEAEEASAPAPVPEVQEPAPKAEPKPKKKKEPEQNEVAQELDKAMTAVKPPYSFPPISLLKVPGRSSINGTEEMKENSRRLNETLESFKIDAHIVNVTRGPSVTRYEVELDKGVRLSKLTSCADDIALSLGASGVRIAAVPGKISVVGIEVPNRAVTTVSLREVIDSNEFNKSAGLSTFAVGKDIGGSCIIGNIAKMPHMLIAGTTGSGKSVCMNSIIISLLYKASPEDVKLIMVDPKMVELANYNGIPHLMIPVVTDPKKAAGALQWAVTEMMRRYKTMSDAGVRDLESYNSIIDAEGGEKVPQLIVIIDELADLMMVAAKEVEDSICRIAQMGRASGVHLVIATQRPSADVITGLMKANIPSRIAFSVASAMESRIILDTQGAEKLVGKGDMLFAPIGNGKPLRVQGCFVTDGEVLAVTNYVKEHYIADYDQDVLADIEKKAQQTGKKAAVSVSDPEPNADELEGDELLPQAVDVVLETGQASVSMLQRRLKLGYSRAARIVDEMEEKGIVGPFQGSKPRNILITKEQWETMKPGASQMSMEDMAVPEDF